MGASRGLKMIGRPSGTFCMFASRRLLVTALFLTLTGWAVPARAVVRADFNGDGVLDTASLEPGSLPVIEVSLSGIGHALRLVIPERPLFLAAADIDSDGRVDLVGTSKSKGLFFWRNRPGARFKSVPRHLAARRTRLSVLSATSGAFHRSSRGRADDTSIDSAGREDTPGVFDTSTRGDAFALARSRLHASTSAPPYSGHERSGPSRAPPA